jgi:protein-S-isoprenylcysteine O-methyltransferase Ste14
MSPGARRTRAAGQQQPHQHNWEVSVNGLTSAACTARRPARRRPLSAATLNPHPPTPKPKNPKQFFGPHGPLLLVPALPAVVLGLVYACNAEGCLSLAPLFLNRGDWRAALASLPGWPRSTPLYSHEALLAAAGWFLLVLLLHVLLPGKEALGAPLPDGSGRRLKYKLNAFSVFLVLYGSALVLSFGFGALDLTWVADNFLPLATASVILSTGLAVVVYVASFLSPGAGQVAAIANEDEDEDEDEDSSKRKRLLSAHGATGVVWYDFWMGRELNPRVRLSLFPRGAATCPLLPRSIKNWIKKTATKHAAAWSFDLDLKEFCELYPGMIGWALLNLSFAYAQHKTHPNQGLLSLGISNAMLLVNAFELWYVSDALLNERAILTTMDITTDGFGFMLSFGDLSWVPFTFATQARFLAESAGAPDEQHLSNSALLGVLGVQAIGYLIFRGANGQKNAFRSNPRDPAVAHLKSMPTKRGTRLLVSGWWGLARHINYLGDWIMGVAWCLPTGIRGLSAAVPFFYALYFASLLAHRERRDDAACLVKYGREDWGKYCALVPWRIVPWVY